MHLTNQSVGHVLVGDVPESTHDLVCLLRQFFQAHLESPAAPRNLKWLKVGPATSGQQLQGGLLLFHGHIKLLDWRQQAAFLLALAESDAFVDALCGLFSREKRGKGELRWFLSYLRMEQSRPGSHRCGGRWLEGRRQYFWGGSSKGKGVGLAVFGELLLFWLERVEGRRDPEEGRVNADGVGAHIKYKLY